VPWRAPDKNFGWEKSDEKIGLKGRARIAQDEVLGKQGQYT